MKRILLFGIILSMSFAGFAQKRGSLVTKEQKKVVRTATYTQPIYDLGNLEQTGNATVGNFVEFEGHEVIGNTDYDFQSNAAIGNRLTVFPDGTMAATYTYGAAGAGPNFDGRGTGYVYHDGNSWSAEPTIAIESDRAGWPSHAFWGENGEIVVAHAWGGTVYTQGGLIISTRPEKGTGDWSESIFLGPTGWEGAAWPRMCTNGENNMNVHIIHALNAEYNGMTDALLYNRSTDGGETWDILHQQIDGLTADEYTEISADRYTWANPVGDNIAFCLASPWYTDLIVMKSDNSGEDWEKIIVWEHPYPFFDWDATITTDSLWAPDGGVDIAMDPEGKVHLIATLCRIAHEEAGTNYSYWPYGEGVVYWNEDRDPFEADNPHDALNAWDPEVLEPDVELIGWGQDMDGDGLFTLFNDGLHTYRTIGANTFPNISCGNNGVIAVAWSGISEVDVYNETNNYRRIWTRISTDGGETWTEHYNINSDITMSFDECIYPCFANVIDGNINLLYQADYDIGTAVDADHDYLNNRTTHYYIENPTIGITDNRINSVSFSISQNYPNPSSTTTKVNVELQETGANLSLEMSNTIGQVVYAKDLGSVNNKQTTFVIDVSEFTPGIYFYTIKVNDESVTRKMIIE